MLKRFIEDCSGKEILDVDEVIKTETNFALECDPYEMCSPFNLRSSRNKRLSDENKNYYTDTYKRLFYLVNDFGLNYQPRIIVFVEGPTAEIILPEFFEWYCGGRPEHFGIEFVNLEGIDKLLSTSRIAEDLKKLIYEIQKAIEDKAVPKRYIEKLTKLIKKLKSTDIIISNFTSFISYNLEKWQITPIFIADDEGNIKHFLEAENPIRYDDQNYNVPSDWKFLWGVDNEDKPFRGSSFEFSNYNDEEISSAVGEVLGEEIEKNLIKSRRDEGVGIKKISDKIFGIKKIEINKILCRNLLTKLDKSKEDDLIERPVFKIIKKIYEMAAFNYLPVDRQVEINNNTWIKEILRGICFGWTKIPGTDDERLKGFLGNKYDIDWVYAAGIVKSEDGKTIYISQEDKTLSLTLNNEESEVLLKIDNIGTDKFIAKKENGMLNIYKGIKV